MALTLDEVVQKYVTNTAYQEQYQRDREKRDATAPIFQGIISRFVTRHTDLRTLRTELSSHTSELKLWGAQGPGFMMEMNKLSKHHDEQGQSAEDALREALTGLDASHLGERIERFYAFLLAERERLRRAGKSSNMIVAARSSSFIISLFAYWLNPDQSFAYYDTVRRGFFTLIKAGVVSAPPGIHIGPNAIEVLSASDHEACLALISELTTREPALPAYRYWIEYFCYWVTINVQSLTEPSNILVTDTAANNILIQVSDGVTAPRSLAVKEAAPDYTLLATAAQEDGEVDAEMALLIKAEPLKPTPEPFLTRLIHEVQRLILVDEAVIRRIYHALLAGHVILTGPPGTGKTELARMLPEVLWRSEINGGIESEGANETPPFDTRTAYTTRLVTATDEWSVRTLISGIAPKSKNGSVLYTVQYGFLTDTIQRNWSSNGNRPEEWSQLRRKMVTGQSAIQRGTLQTFRGQWLIIDEFNRAPIDIAFGDALSALGGNDVLRVSIEGGSAELPIPQDFRIIGTLNSFDRNYLNQISEALKRRFSFIEILPPTRAQRAAEQSIVLSKALSRVSHLTDTISSQEEEGTLYWQTVASISFDPSGLYTIAWEDEQHAFREVFETAWRIFETIRIYRQLGTAQAITLIRSMLIAGILQGYTTREAWMGALDVALCDTLADQLQVLLPDEVEALLLYLTTDRAGFSDAYQRLLTRLSSTPQRLYGQLLSLSSVSDGNGQPLLTDEEVEAIAGQNQPIIPAAKLAELFQPGQSASRLPQFTRRLRAFKAERGL